VSSLGRGSEDRRDFVRYSITTSYSHGVAWNEKDDFDTRRKFFDLSSPRLQSHRFSGTSSFDKLSSVCDMDAYTQGWLAEIVGSVVVGLGSLLLGAAFRAAPLLTVLGSILLVLLVGFSLFMYLSPRQDRGGQSPLARTSHRRHRGDVVGTSLPGLGLLLF
jgi:hypothetical protein